MKRKPKLLIESLLMRRKVTQRHGYRQVPINIKSLPVFDSRFEPSDVVTVLIQVEKKL